MSEPSPLSERERADLVAYLDGELTGEAARALEAKLSLHPQARAEAEALRRTWAMLDFLPRAKPSADFTHRTMERLPSLRSTGRRRWWAGWPGLAWVLAMLLAGWGGYAAYNRLAPVESAVESEEQHIKDLQERQWIEKLPRKVREELEKLPAEKRAARIADLHEQERRQQREWRRR
jgi:anti-sigma factor RsiW